MKYRDQIVIEPIGTVIVKISGRPFKSSFKQATVKGYIIHPKTKRQCYTFEEDDTYVECLRCIKL